MHGDFTRFTFDPKKRYSRVLRQQGRVDLDADWLEAAEIQLERYRTHVRDVVGPVGVPREQPGFGIKALEATAAHPRDLLISTGRLYVDGHQCEVFAGKAGETNVRYTEQVDLPVCPPIQSGDGALDLVYLHAWERHVTILEDPSLSEPALEGLDTATRTQMLTQVKVARLDDTQDGMELEARWKEIARPTDGTLSSWLGGTGANGAQGSYTGTGNHLYRVEVHDSGAAYGSPWTPDAEVFMVPKAADTESGAAMSDDRPAASGSHGAARAVLTPGAEKYGRVAYAPGQWVEIRRDTSRPGTLAKVVRHDEETGVLELTKTGPFSPGSKVEVRAVASYKWSRDNGVVCYAIAAEAATSSEAAVQEIVVRRRGRDSRLAVAAGDLVEILDDRAELTDRRGQLRHVLAVDETTNTIRFDQSVRFDASAHPKIRRWDHGPDQCELPLRFAGRDDDAEHDLLEENIHISFGGTYFRAGDYWTIAARPATKGIERLENAPPRGIQHRFVQLALVRWGTGAGPTDARVMDRRRLFGSVADAQDATTVTVGDGVASGAQYHDIEEALAALHGSGTLRVQSGEYVLKRPLSIEHDQITLEAATGSAVLVAPPGAAALVLKERRGIRIRGLEFRLAKGATAIRAEGGSDLQIESCATSSTKPAESGPCIRLVDVDRATIRDCDITGGQAVDVRGTSITIRDNRCRGGGISILQGSMDVEVRGNAIVQARDDGIRAGERGPKSPRVPHRTGPMRRILIDGNHVVDAGRNGIDIGPSAKGAWGSLNEVEVKGNQIAGCGDAINGADAGGGILARGVSQISITNNLVQSNARLSVAGTICGIGVHGCIGANISENLVVGNGRRDPKDLRSAFQVGILVEGACAASLPWTRRKGELAPDDVHGIGPVAVQVHRNDVVCPCGPSLFVTGIGAMSIQANRLTSYGLRPCEDNGRDFGESLFVGNVGQDVTRSTLLLVPGLDSRLHLEHHADAKAGPKRFGGVPIEDNLPDGRIVFSGNQVTLRDEHRPETDVSAGAIIASNDDVSLEANQFVAEVPGRILLANVVARAPTVRATDNRFRELPWGSTHSLVVQAHFGIASSNQASHGIQMMTKLAKHSTNEGNQVIYPYASASGFRKRQRDQAARKGRRTQIRRRLQQIHDAYPQLLDDVRLGARLRLTALDNDQQYAMPVLDSLSQGEQSDLKDDVATFRALVTNLDRADAREARRPRVKPDCWVIAGRVIDETGIPFPGLVVQLEAKGLAIGADEWERRTILQDSGDFAFVFRKDEVSRFTPELRLSVYRPEARNKRGKLSKRLRLLRAAAELHYEKGSGDYYEIVLPRPDDIPAPPDEHDLVGKRSPRPAEPQTLTSSDTPTERHASGPDGDGSADSGTLPETGKNADATGVEHEAGKENEEETEEHANDDASLANEILADLEAELGDAVGVHEAQEHPNQEPTRQKGKKKRRNVLERFFGRRKTR